SLPHLDPPASAPRESPGALPPNVRGRPTSGLAAPPLRGPIRSISLHGEDCGRGDERRLFYLRQSRRVGGCALDKCLLTPSSATHRDAEAVRWMSHCSPHPQRPGGCTPAKGLLTPSTANRRLCAG